jgi:hypothetical protein
MRGFHHITFALAASLLVGQLAAQDAKKENPASVRAAESLQAIVAALKVEPGDKDKTRWQFWKAPLLKYNDAAREYLAAGVWRLGEEGRASAFLTLQYAQRDEWRLDYELLTFTDVRFEVESPRLKIAAGALPEFAPLKDAEKPAATEKQRLIQLRSLARRFTATEKYREDTIALRLLPQPIDRYVDGDQDVIDGGVFVFVYGTNPEVVLALEAGKDGWRYAIGRLAWAELAVELDGQEIARFEHLKDNPTTGPYRTAGHEIEPLQP